MSLPPPHLRTAVLLCGLLSVASVAAAQTAAAPAEPQTRAEQLQQQREAKSLDLKPHQPNALERSMDLIEGKAMPFLMRDGVYGKFGSISTSSGFAYGAGYREYVIASGHEAPGMRSADPG